MAPQFDITPEKQASLLHFWRQQVFSKPAEVRGSERLQGKTAIVTGSNTGVGYQTARQLLDLGVAKLVLGVRSEEKGRAAAAALAAGREGLAADAVEVWPLDHSSYDSVVAFASRARGLARLDLVNLNVGFVPSGAAAAAAAAAGRVRNAATGHDEIVQVNYLSTALLALLLLPVVKDKRDVRGPPGRITFTSSEASAWTRFGERTEPGPLLAALDAGPPGRAVDPMDRMWVSKLLGQLFLARLAAEVPSSVVVINAASPATVYDSDFMRGMHGTLAFSVGRVVLSWLVNPSAVGARMITDAMVNHGDETHGQFLSFQKMVPMSPLLYTEEGQRISEKLWKETMAEFSFARAEEVLKGVKE